MEQTRVVSAIEAGLNTFSGFFISWGVWVFIVGPVFGIPTSMGQGLAVTSIFTVSSLLRTYIVRRFFNNGYNNMAVNIVKRYLS